MFAYRVCLYRGLTVHMLKHCQLARTLGALLCWGWLTAAMGMKGLAAAELPLWLRERERVVEEVFRECDCAAADLAEDTLMGVAGV